MPVVVLADAWEPPTLAESAILADRLLRREDDSLLLDAAERRELSDEIAAAPVYAAMERNEFRDLAMSRG